MSKSGSTKGSGSGSNSVRNDSGENTTSSSESSTKSGERSVREFLYLDYEKLTSYLAQVRKGLPKGKTRIKGSGTRELVTDPEHETGVEGSVAAGLEGGVDPNIAKLLGLMAEVDFKLSRLTRSGGDEYERTKAEQLIETKELHHDVFSVVEETFEQRELIETVLGRQASKKPFYRAQGSADIIYFNHIIDNLEKFDEMRDAFLGVSGQKQDIGTIDNAEHLLYLLRRFYKDRLAVVLHSEGKTVSAILDPAQLRTPLEMLIDNYGRQTHVRLTLLGYVWIKVGEGSERSLAVILLRL